MCHTSMAQAHDPRGRTDLQTHKARVVSAQFRGLEEFEEAPGPGFKVKG